MRQSVNRFGGPRHGTELWCHAQLPVSQVLPVGAHQSSSHLVTKHKNVFHTSAEMHFLYLQCFTSIPLSDLILLFTKSLGIGVFKWFQPSNKRLGPANPWLRSVWCDGWAHVHFFTADTPIMHKG